MIFDLDPVLKNSSRAPGEALQ